MIHKTYPKIFQTYLTGFNTLWGQLLSVTTFTLTFFVNQSYALWRKCMELSRRLQGRLHDVNMNMASHAERVVPANPNDKSTYTAPARQILELLSRYTRLFNLLTYASFTRSHRPILTPRGLRRLVERGLMTETEREVLVDAVIPATQRHSVVLMWMIRLFVEGRAAGHIQGGHGFESETMHKFHIIRSQYGAIGDELQGRMPLAYAHIVQVLVDLILWMFPIMAFTTGMSAVLVVFGTGLLTISYQGLFDLAKQFLDPYDNENYGRGEDPLCVDTLIAETNAGSIRWLYGFEELPFSAQRLNDGELYEYLLPVRGYSVEELDEMERERVEREKQLEEQRKREDEEEAERLREEAEEAELKELEMDEEESILAEAEDSVEMDAMEENATIAESMEALEALERKVDPSTIEFIEATENSTDTEVEEEIVEATANAIKSTAPSTDTAETARLVHKVMRLADGTPITDFKPSSKDSQEKNQVIEEPVPTGMQTSNYLATLRMQTERIKSLLAAAELEEEDLIEEAMLDLESYEDLPWFDEIGSDGQEFRLSQQLADEVFEEPTDDIQTFNMTKEEYEERLKEIEQDAQDELKATTEIMSATAGAEGLYTVTERRRKKAPTYDQTRLDGISQLWGLPPEDPASLSEYQPPEKIDDVGFDAISQLWGGSGLSDASKSPTTSTQKQDDAEVVGMGSFSGISELWGPVRNDFRDDTADMEDGDNKTISDSGERDILDEDVEEYISFGGLPWHDEKGPDGQDYRLSQMLADEEWATETKTEELEPMTLEDYNEQVKEITEKLEEELRETEAILLSKPGTDPVGWDYDDEDLAPMSNTTSTDGEEEDEEHNVVKDSDLSVLEMDVDAEDELAAMVLDDNIDADLGITNGDVILEEDADLSISDADLEANGALGDEEVPDVVSPPDVSGIDQILNDIQNISESSSNEETAEDEINGQGDESTKIEEDLEIESTDDDDDYAESNDVKDKIEPILIDDDEESNEVKDKIEPIFVDDDEESNDVKDKIEPILIDEDEESNDVKDKIEPIFLEEQDEDEEIPPISEGEEEEEDDIRIV